MNVLAVVDGDEVRLRVVGTLAFDTAERFLDAVRRNVDTMGRGGSLRVDLGRCEFCDSMGLSGLLSVRKLAEQTGLTLHLDAVPAFLDNLLGMTGLRDRVLGTGSGPAGDHPSAT